MVLPLWLRRLRIILWHRVNEGAGMGGSFLVAVFRIGRSF